MQLLWELKEAFVKDIIQNMPEPKPPYNTVSSIIRILEEKGMVSHKTYGKTYQYFPAIGKKEYSLKAFKSLVKDYFEGSYANVMSFLIREEGLTEEEINELKNLIQQKENE